MSADKLVDSSQLETDLTSVANAIRTKGGTSASLAFPADFVTAINAISGGGGSTLVTKTITANGTYSANDDSADGYSEVTVNVSGGGGMSTETIIPSQSINCSVSLRSDVYGGYIQSYTEYIENEEEYIVTFDGTEYFARGHYRSSSILVAGDYYLSTGTSYTEFPFCVTLQNGSLFYLIVQGTGTHTLKVDKILSYSGGSSATLITKSITANGTYSASDDSANGYSSVTVNVPSSATSSWTKVAETSYQVSTTSTSATTVATWETGHSEIWTSDKIVYVRVRDTAGKRNGYFYGVDQFFFNYTAKNHPEYRGVSENLGIITNTWRCDSDGYYSVRYGYYSIGYGIYADTFYDDGRIRIRSRYNSTSTTTIDGTYKVEVYLLDPAGGVPIFT